MARTYSADRGVPETQYESVAAMVFPLGMVLYSRRGVGGDTMWFDAYGHHLLTTSGGSPLDRDFGGNPSLNLPPADTGHKPSP